MTDAAPDSLQSTALKHTDSARRDMPYVEANLLEWFRDYNTTNYDKYVYKMTFHMSRLIKAELNLGN